PLPRLVFEALKLPDAAAAVEFCRPPIAKASDHAAKLAAFTCYVKRIGARLSPRRCDGELAGDAVLVDELGNEPAGLGLGDEVAQVRSPRLAAAPRRADRLLHGG